MGTISRDASQLMRITALVKMTIIETGQEIEAAGHHGDEQGEREARRVQQLAQKIYDIIFPEKADKASGG